MLSPYNILAFTEIGLPPTYVYVRRMGIVIMPECCVNASLFLIAELRPANFSDAFWCQKIVSLSTAEKSTCVVINSQLEGRFYALHLFAQRFHCLVRNSICCCIFLCSALQALTVIAFLWLWILCTLFKTQL